MEKIRTADISDLQSVLEIDGSVIGTREREQYLSDNIVRGCCYVFCEESMVLGFMVFNYSFFEQGFVSLIVVNPRFQRKGVGRALLIHAEKICKRNKLFSSTNQSNERMKSLFKKLGFKESGVVENLDDGDPEVFFFKRLV